MIGEMLGDLGLGRVTSDLSLRSLAGYLLSWSVTFAPFVNDYGVTSFLQWGAVRLKRQSPCWEGLSHLQCL